LHSKQLRISTSENTLAPIFVALIFHQINADPQLSMGSIIHNFHRPHTLKVGRQTKDEQLVDEMHNFIEIPT
jgi:hypothetical protein